MASSLQGWVVVVGGLLTAALAIMQYFGQRSRRERASTVGSSFAAAVDGLSAPEPAKQMAAAVLLRRFFDPSTRTGGGEPTLPTRGDIRHRRIAWRYPFR
jgi:hypothetical protein